jgi:hypothetical protein
LLGGAGRGLKRMKILLMTALGFLAGAVSAQAADECPNAQSAAAGFVAERNVGKTEVFRVGKTDIRTVYRYRGQVLQETTLFQGLFELERIYEGRRIVSRPLTDLSGNFPPAPGKTITGKFETTEGTQKSNEIVVLQVRKADALYIGPCQYKVLKIDRSVGNGRGSPVFLRTDYYSPDLKFIIAHEYRENGGRTTLNKFDRIYPMAH